MEFPKLEHLPLFCTINPLIQTQFDTLINPYAVADCDPPIPLYQFITSSIEHLTNQFDLLLISRNWNSFTCIFGIHFTISHSANIGLLIGPTPAY